MEDTNSLIAEFMGYESYEYRGYRMFVFEENNHRTHVDLHYHKSWDWLMPVIDRIKEIRNLPDDHDESFSWVCKTSIIESEYNAVVEFIKQQN